MTEFHLCYGAQRSAVTSFLCGGYRLSVTFHLCGDYRLSVTSHLCRMKVPDLLVARPLCIAQNTLFLVCTCSVQSTIFSDLVSACLSLFHWSSELSP